MPEFAPGVTLITCTGDRPEALTRCSYFVSMQKFKGPTQWIIVDDGQPFLPSCAPGGRPLIRGLTIGEQVSMNSPLVDLRILRPSPKWTPGTNTLARNLLAAIPEVRYDKVLFIEDDDWYAPDYVETMAAELEFVPIAGNRDAKYYHLPSRRWRIMHNQHSASLCETAIRAELLPTLAFVCKEGGDFIDGRLWESAGNRTLRIDLPAGRVVGIKGLPGRPGIGVGHRPDSRPAEWTADPELTVLKEWIGEDVELYREFLC